MRIILAACVLSVISACAPASFNAQVNDALAAPDCAKPRTHYDYSYIVFFDDNSASLTLNGQKVLTNLAKRWRLDGGLFLEALGHTDQAEAGTAPKTLALQRAVTTKDFLISQGIEAQRIMPQSFAASSPMVKNSASEPQNRRVELLPIFKESGEEARLVRVDRQMCHIWVADHCFPSSRFEHAGGAACNAALHAATGL